jgi:hypothetical protein
MYVFVAEEPHMVDPLEVMREDPPAADQPTLPTSRSPPGACQPNPGDEASSSRPVPGALVDMLSKLGNSFRCIQDNPNGDPERVTAWMHSILGSMNMVS